MFRSLIALVTALATGATSLLGTAAQAQERDLKFVLDFISLGRHAPWYVALGKGYFKDEGLNVTIMPSKGTADAIRTVATGGAELGFIDIPSLVASGSAGSAVKIVAANYQKPPYCIFTLNPGANVTEPKQMAGLELGSSTASFSSSSTRTTAPKSCRGATSSSQTRLSPSTCTGASASCSTRSWPRRSCCRARPTAGAACPRSDAAPSSTSHRPPGRRSPTPARVAWRSGPGRSWWPTTCGWPRPTSPRPGGSPPSCARRPCAPWAWPSGPGCRSR